jgi:aspartyl-tRNA(Asn)/glutamyl-tRNA(Gln) amidotransferase subunit C
MISLDDIKKLSHLAKIKLNGKEANDLQVKLSDIMGMIDSLKEVDTEGIVPLTSVVDATNRLREDEVNDGDIQENLFKNAPGKNADLAKEIKCFVVPKVVE